MIFQALQKKTEELKATSTIAEEKVKTAMDEAKAAQEVAKEVKMRLELGERRWTELERNLRVELKDRKICMDRINTNLREKEDNIRKMRSVKIMIMMMS